MEGLVNSLQKTLSKFKLDEFADVVSYVFGDVLLWETVSKKVDKLRLDRRPRTVAEVCCMLYQNKKPTKEEAMKSLWLLQLYDVAVHSNRKWFGIRLREPFPDAPPSLEDIEKNVSRAFRKELKNATVFESKLGRLQYIMVIEEKMMKKGSKFLSPVFFVVDAELQQPFAFYTPKLKKKHPLECICQAIGYQDYRLLSLSGDDVEKLFQAASRKQDGTVALRASLLQIVPVTQGHVTDLTGYSSRQKYAMNTFPGGRIQMKTLTVKSENEWRGTSVVPHLKKDCVIETSITFQSKKQGRGVDDVLRELIAQGNIKTPLPSWLLKYSQQPKNTMQLYSQATFSNSSGGAFERTDGTDNRNSDDSMSDS